VAGGRARVLLPVFFSIPLQGLRPRVQRRGVVACVICLCARASGPSAQVLESPSWERTRFCSCSLSARAPPAGHTRHACARSRPGAFPGCLGARLPASSLRTRAVCTGNY